MIHKNRTFENDTHNKIKQVEKVLKTKERKGKQKEWRVKFVS